jgi:hypothetical protein
MTKATAAAVKARSKSTPTVTQSATLCTPREASQETMIAARKMIPSIIPR